MNSATVCSDCGAQLELGDAPSVPATAPVYQELETIYETSNQIQAQLIRSLLEQASISAHISGESLQGALGELPPTMLYLRIQVPVEEAERARAIVLESERSGA